MTIIFDGRFEGITDNQLNLPYCEMGCVNSDPGNRVLGTRATTPLGAHDATEEDRIKYFPSETGKGGKACVRFRLYKRDRLSYDDAASPGFAKSSVLRSEMGYYISGATTVEPIDGTPRWYWTSFWVDPGYDSDQYSSVFQLHNAATHYVSGANLNLATGMISIPVGFRHRYQVIFARNSNGNAAATAPGGLTYGLTYWVYNPTDHPTDFKLCTTLANCNAGTTITLTNKGTYDGTNARTVAPANVITCEWTLSDKNLHHPSMYAGQQEGQFFSYNFVDVPGFDGRYIDGTTVSGQPRVSDGKVLGIDKFLWQAGSMNLLAGQWNDVVIRGVWKSDNTGELTIWVNRKKIYNEKGVANQGFEQMTPFFKIGVYAAGTWPKDDRPFIENYNQGLLYANTTNMEDNFNAFMAKLGKPDDTEILRPYSPNKLTLL